MAFNSCTVASKSIKFLGFAVCRFSSNRVRRSQKHKFEGQLCGKKNENTRHACNLLPALKPWYRTRKVPIPTYSLDQLRFDQPGLWLPLALRACRLACNAAAGESTTFEISRFSSEQDQATGETLSIVHVDEDPTLLPVVTESASNEWLQIAAATVISVFLRNTTGEQIQRVCRSETGLGYYLESREGDEDSLLIVVGSTKDDVRAALEHAIAVAGTETCAHKIAAAVAFGSNKAALRVLS